MRCPSPARCLALALACAALLQAVPALAVLRGSPLAVPLVAGRERPLPMLAQRSIVRDWGPSEDSTYTELEVPEWKSEGRAAVFTAALPGAGQLYAGEGSGFWFALAEVAGWTANRVYLHRAQSDRDESVRFAGEPTDTTSAWSFERWENATGGDAGDIRRVYAMDRGAFFEIIARDPAYLAGWKGDPAATHSAYYDIRGRSRSNYDRATLAGWALWLNHLIAAVDALHAARLHNLPLQQNLELKVRSSWRHGSPDVTAALVRRF